MNDEARNEEFIVERLRTSLAERASRDPLLGGAVERMAAASPEERARILEELLDRNDVAAPSPGATPEEIADLKDVLATVQGPGVFAGDEVAVRVEVVGDGDDRSVIVRTTNQEGEPLLGVQLRLDSGGITHLRALDDEGMATFEGIDARQLRLRARAGRRSAGQATGGFVQLPEAGRSEQRKVAGANAAPSVTAEVAPGLVVSVVPGTRQLATSVAVSAQPRWNGDVLPIAYTDRSGVERLVLVPLGGGVVGPTKVALVEASEPVAPWAAEPRSASALSDADADVVRASLEAASVGAGDAWKSIAADRQFDPVLARLIEDITSS